MRTTSIRPLGTLLTSLCALISAPAAAQLSTTANGPYFAMPSWSQKLTTNRFVVLTNWNQEAVLDRETGLVWERAPDATMRTWSVAHDRCKNRSVGGRKGWRLPAVQELASLLEPTAGGPVPTIPAGHPFVNVEPSFYWSASIVQALPNHASVVAFDNAMVYGAQRTDSYHVWCVRGGPVTDVQ